MNAIPVENITQRTPQWHAWRKGGIGASEAAQVLGISPWGTAYALFLEKTGKVVKPPFQTDAMRRGVEYEDGALLELETELGQEIDTRQTLFEHPDYPFIRASVDGMLPDAVVEIKVPGPAQFEAMKKGLPDYYMAQVQQQMLVTGKDKAIFYVWSPEHGGYIHEVAADKKWHRRIIEAETAFWDAVQKGQWPRDEMSELVEELAQRKQQLDEAKSAFEAAQKRLIELMQSRETKKVELPSGIKATVTTRMGVDRQAVMKIPEYAQMADKVAEIKTRMKAIEDQHKTPGKPYIRLTLPK